MRRRILLAWLGFACACSTTPEQSIRERVALGLESTANSLRRTPSVDPAIDLDALVARSKSAFSDASMDDERAALIAAHVFVSGLRKGHSGVFGVEVMNFGQARYLDCPNGLTYSKRNRLGACLAPRGDDFVVTFAESGNALALKPGDVIEGVGERHGRDLHEALEAIPTCQHLYPSDSGRRMTAAQKILSVTPEGTPLEIRGVDGAVRRIPMPAPRTETPWTNCEDVFARPNGKPTVATRSDGIKVMHVPSFKWGSTLNGMLTDLSHAIGELSSAELVVWDLRGSIGGHMDLATKAAGALPGARDVPVLDCPYAGALRPNLIESPGKVRRAAILVDGGAYSASSIFVRLAAVATNAVLVGSEDAAAYSNSPAHYDIAGTPLTIDMELCRDSTTKNVAEAHPPSVKVPVEYDPADLAAGRDTVLEAAAKVLLDGD